MYIILFKNINQLRESRCNIHTLLILNSLDSLVEHLLDYAGKICLGLRIICLVKIHENSNKWSLPISSHQSNNLILNHLYTTIDFFFNSKLCNLIYLIFIQFKTSLYKLILDISSKLLSANLHKWCKMSK